MIFYFQLFFRTVREFFDQAEEENPNPTNMDLDQIEFDYWKNLPRAKQFAKMYGVDVRCSFFEDPRAMNVWYVKYIFNIYIHYYLYIYILLNFALQ